MEHQFSAEMKLNAQAFENCIARITGSRISFITIIKVEMAPEKLNKNSSSQIPLAMLSWKI